jgi:hypothetical protein
MFSDGWYSISIESGVCYKPKNSYFFKQNLEFLLIFCSVKKNCIFGGKSRLEGKLHFPPKNFV